MSIFTIDAVLSRTPLWYVKVTPELTSYTAAVTRFDRPRRWAAMTGLRKGLSRPRARVVVVVVDVVVVVNVVVPIGIVLARGPFAELALV